MTSVPTPAEIEASATRIAPYIRRTPILDLGHAVSDEFTLAVKLEHLQVTGSFKPRGAFSVLTATSVPEAGVVAASGGNFGIAVAYACSRLGCPATIFVPKTSPTEKIDRIGIHGADVRVIDGYYDQAKEAAEEFAAGAGAFLAHAYDQLEVMAGQGTLAIEIDEQTRADVVVAAVGGGGLIGGMASWFRDRTTVVAVEPETCRSLNAAFAAGRPIKVDVSGVAASSLGARSVGEHPWQARKWIDHSVLVTDEEIVEAQRWLWAHARLAVEPAAGATLAAVLTGAFRPTPGARVVAVLSGGNVDPRSVA